MAPREFCPQAHRAVLQFIAVPMTSASNVNFGAEINPAILIGQPIPIRIIYEAEGGISPAPDSSIQPLNATTGSGGVAPTPDAFCAASLPPGASSVGFNRTCMQFLNNAGYPNSQMRTFDYTVQLDGVMVDQLLANDATALSRIGVYEYDATKLLNYEYKKDGFDVFNQRYHQGAFGYGPSQTYDITAGMNNGVPAIFQPDGSIRKLCYPKSCPGESVSGFTWRLRQADHQWRWHLDGHRKEWSHSPPHRRSSGQFQQPASLRLPPGSSRDRITAAYSNGLMASVTDSFGNSISFTYDSNGHITQATDPVGRVTTYTYDTLNDALHSAFLTSVSTSGGIRGMPGMKGGPSGVGYFSGSCVTTYCEPAIGINTITYPNGTHTYFTYDSLGRMISSSRDGNTETITYAYNPSGDVTVTNSAGNTATLSANQLGVLGQVTDPFGTVTSYAYDPENKPVSVLGPLGSSSSTRYDSSSNPVELPIRWEIS